MPLIIYPTHEYARVKSIKHRNLHKIIKTVLENKEEIKAQYIPMTLYALANFGFADKEFFGAILSLIPYAHNLLKPEDMVYIIQALAMSGLSEYNKFFEGILPSIFRKMLNFNEITQELAIVQIISSMVYLNLDVSQIEDFEYHIDNILNLLPSQNTEDYIFMLSPRCHKGHLVQIFMMKNYSIKLLEL